jgi:hypothetical protein
MILAMAKAAGSQEADYYARILDELADPRTATHAEITALVSPGSRATARRDAARLAGWRGAVAVHRLQRAQAGLAVRLSREGAGPGPAGLDRYAEVHAARHRLESYGLAGSAPLAGPHTRRIWPHVVIGLAVVAFAVALGLLLRVLTS